MTLLPLCIQLYTLCHFKVPKNCATDDRGHKHYTPLTLVKHNACLLMPQSYAQASRQWRRALNLLGNITLVKSLFNGVFSPFSPIFYKILYEKLLYNIFLHYIFFQLRVRTPAFSNIAKIIASYWLKPSFTAYH